MKLEIKSGKITWSSGGFEFGPGAPKLRIDGAEVNLRFSGVNGSNRKRIATWRAGGTELAMAFAQEAAGRIRVTTTLRNDSTQPRTLNHVTLFECRRVLLGAAPAEVRVLEQNAYVGHVRTPRQMWSGSDGLKALDGTMGAFTSQNHAVFYDPAVRRAVLVGFETVDRWLPEIKGRMNAAVGRAASVMDNVDGGAPQNSETAASAAAEPGRVPPFRRFEIGFDGGDLRIEPGELIKLGDFVLEDGNDPLDLLAGHGARIKLRNKFPDPPGPLANWCSWYPYRLGVSEENVRATARVARARNLDQLGLKYLQVDLGWEKDNIPTYFEENERFSHGLGWLSARLRAESFELGVWVGVLCVADTHPIAREHPEWLLRGEDGKPFVNYHWFWEPFCAVYSLDVSHPGAQVWLRENFTALARKGVRYVKWDFAGIVTGEKLRRRHAPRMVNARAREAVRTAFRIAQDALNSQGEPALMLDCSGVDYAGAGVTGLAYANLDTGNSGIGWRHLREVYTSYACHLFKHRWALLQPSCLVVGLPGTLEEARLRATVTFMGAGHVDIGDDLITLPEDRWSVLLATLPPNDTPAKVVDLFHPVRTGTLTYLAMIKSKEKKDPKAEKRSAMEAPQERAPEGTNIWALPVKTDWDEWTLVAVYNWTEPAIEPGSGVNLARRYQVELTRLGLPADGKFWAYEFWSGQFFGEIPRAEISPGAYRHPGDFTHPIQQSGPGWFDIGFHGPAVKLVILRRPRAHPWPLGTSFHQSGGRELADVKWNARTRTLSGRLLRPKGQSGFIMIACPEKSGVRAHRLSLTAMSDSTKWSVQLG
ncbi:MAG: Alpha-xylosidase [Verrucomicrobia bacterium]|nr:Alpha-xylosidase [Verrucomicrobiota bacterium]